MVRTRLGESLDSIQETDPVLVEYATPSWEALQHLRSGGDALAASDIPRAVRELERALQVDPEFPAALASLGLLYVELLQKPDDGRRLLDAALKNSSPASTREHLMIRALHKQFVTADAAGALEDYRYVSSLYPDIPQPYNNSGRLLVQLGRHADAAAMFERAHALDPRHTMPLWNLWELHLNRLDDPRKAEQYAKVLAELQPQNPWVRHLMAWTDVALRRFDRAEEGMRAVLTMSPLHHLAIANLGHLLLRRGAAEEAAGVYQDMFEKARAGVLSLHRSDAALFHALALQDAGRADEARAVLRAEIAALGGLAARDPNPWQPLYLANLHAANGDRVAAERALARARQKPAADPYFVYNQARTHALLGDLERAAALLQEARDRGHDQPYFPLVDPALRALKDHPVVERIAVRTKGE
jgi:tetratricopeptide (TPR) repeat protein